MRLFYHRFKKWALFCEQSHWYQDLSRGVSYVRDRMTMIPDSSFSNVSLLRLRYRLTRIKRRLFSAYQILGRQIIDYQTGQSPLISEEEIERLYQQIEIILEEQRKVEEEMKWEEDESFRGY